MEEQAFINQLTMFIIMVCVLLLIILVAHARWGIFSGFRKKNDMAGQHDNSAVQHLQTQVAALATALQQRPTPTPLAPPPVAPAAGSGKGDHGAEHDNEKKHDSGFAWLWKLMTIAAILFFAYVAFKFALANWSIDKATAEALKKASESWQWPNLTSELKLISSLGDMVSGNLPFFIIIVAVAVAIVAVLMKNRKKFLAIAAILAAAAVLLINGQSIYARLSGVNPAHTVIGEFELGSSPERIVTRAGSCVVPTGDNKDMAKRVPTGESYLGRPIPKFISKTGEKVVVTFMWIPSDSPECNN